MNDFTDLMDEESVGISDQEADMEVMPPDDYIEATRREESDGTVVEDVDAARANFLRDIREEYADDYSADRQNRDAAIEDLKFLAGDQWPKGVRARRLNKQKPVLTLNRLPAFVGLVVNQRRANAAGIHVIPDEGGTKKIAQLRQGIIRSIEKRSRSDYVYNTAHLNQVACGDGAWKVSVNYADEDVFTQDIAIEAIPNAMAVLWDRMATDPTGKDAGHCFVEDYLTEKEFKASYPDAQITDFAGSLEGQTARGENWYVNNTIRVVEYWRMRSRMRTLAMVLEQAEDGTILQNPIVLDVTELPREEWVGRVIRNPETGQPYIRRTRIKYAEMYVTNGVELLEGPFTMPIPRVPVFRAVGWEVYTGQKVQRFGLVRFLKDPQRMHNYWRSIVVEKLMQTPRPKWIAPDTAVKGREDKFRKAAQSDDPLLVYNGEAGVAPQLMPPAQMEAALIEQAGMASQDIRDISNLHEASLGMIGNEVSGKAISARQEIGETGVAVYQDNLNDAIEECGRVINKLIPYIYDTRRKMRIVGTDDKEDLVTINEDKENDVTSGRYDVTVVTGPSYATKRRQAAESMLNMVNAMPDTLAVAADKIVEAQDWPGSESIARRLRMNLPDNMVDPDDLSDEERASREANAQAQQQAQEVAMAKEAADIDMKRAQANDYNARAADAQARAAKTYADIDFERVKLMEEQQKRDFDMLLDGARFYAELTDQGTENYGN